MLYNERAIAERAIGTRPERAYMCLRTRSAPPTRFFPNAARSRTHIPERAPGRSSRKNAPQNALRSARAIANARDRERAIGERTNALERVTGDNYDVYGFQLTNV